MAQFLYEHHPDRFRRILEVMRARVPGVTSVEAKPTVDGRLVLRFQDGNFEDPFIARYVSDGTIKMFAYLVLLHDPKPHPLLAVEEPENQLYPALLARAGRGVPRLRSPRRAGVRVDPLAGVSQRREAGRDLLAREEGRVRNRPVARPRASCCVTCTPRAILPGALWKQRLFEGADPA